jgi:hypothetical protein
MPRTEVNGIEIYYELHGPEDADVLVLSNAARGSRRAPTWPLSAGRHWILGIGIACKL